MAKNSRSRAKRRRQNQAKLQGRVFRSEFWLAQPGRRRRDGRTREVAAPRKLAPTPEQASRRALIGNRNGDANDPLLVALECGHLNQRQVTALQRYRDLFNAVQMVIECPESASDILGRLQPYRSGGLVPEEAHREITRLYGNANIQLTVCSAFERKRIDWMCAQYGCTFNQRTCETLKSGADALAFYWTIKS